MLDRFAGSVIIISVMVRTTSNQHFQHLLRPLYDAGWSEVVPLHRAAAADSAEALQQIALRRSCMVLGVQHVPSPKSREQVIFVPVAAHLEHPDDGIGLFDAVTEPETIVGVSHGLQPFVIEDVGARLGLLDPTRFVLPAGVSAQERVDFLLSLYGRYVGRVAAKWRGGNTLQALRVLDADEPFSQMVKTVMYLAQNVVPDPVPMAAAIGITLDCWRNTELETAHAGRKTLTDVVMAKLNIATTRAVRSYITTTGIDWDGVGGVLLDPERQLAPARTVAGLVGDQHWPAVQASIQAKLDNWLHIASVAGPQATLRLASALGSTDYTAHWWGNGWWTEFSDQVVHHVEDKFPELLPPGDDEFAGRRLASEVFHDHDPESLPDAVLSALIDPPDGKGLRYADLPEIKRHRLGADAAIASLRLWLSVLATPCWSGCSVAHPPGSTTSPTGRAAPHHRPGPRTWAVGAWACRHRSAA